MRSPPGNGESYIEAVFNVTKNDGNSFAYGDFEVRYGCIFQCQAMVVSEEFFSAIGYTENGKQMVCCDAKAIDVCFHVSLECRWECVQWKVS